MNGHLHFYLIVTILYLFTNLNVYYIFRCLYVAALYFLSKIFLSITVGKLSYKNTPKKKKTEN